jgi:hypothetical protein
MLFLYIKTYTINTMKYITYKNHSEYTQDDLRELLDPSSEFKIVNLSEKNNSKDLLYNAPRFTVLRQDETTGEPVVVNDEQLKVFINKEFNNLSDYDTLPSEEYYIINDLYILKNSGYNKNKENMHEFRIKYPGYKPAFVKKFDEIESFVLTPQTDDFTCQIHMNWTNRAQGDDGAKDVDTHVFVYKKNENNELELLNSGWGVYYSNKTFSNNDVDVVLSWDDVTNNSDGNGGKGEYIKIKQKCTDEVYTKYYFVYCLNIYSKTYDDYEPNSSEHDSAVWNDVTITATNGITYEVKTIEPEATPETANKMWCGLLINNNNVLSSADKFASTLQSAISLTEFFYRPTQPGMGNSTSGKVISITLPEFTDELIETPKE